jgi:hypothetical protein
MGLLWVITKNASPFVDIDKYYSTDTVYVKLTNKEPTDLTNVRIRMIRVLIRNNWYSSNLFDDNGLIEVEENITRDKTIKIPLVTGRDGFTTFLFGKKTNFFQLDNRESKTSKGKYGIIFEVFVRIISENEWRLVGKYSGNIIHNRLNGTESFDNKENLVYQDMLIWEDGSFKKLDKKEYAQILKASFAEQSAT